MRISLPPPCILRMHIKKRDVEFRADALNANLPPSAKMWYDRNMRSLIKKIIVIVAVVLSVAGVVGVTNSPVAFAAEGDKLGSCRTFLGMPSWDCGVEDFENQDKLTTNIIQIATNIFTDITVASAYLILGFVIYGGYLYMTAGGDPGKAATSRKVLTRAFIGLAIVLLANVIVNGIRIALVGSGQSLAGINRDAEFANVVFLNAINFAIAISSIVCVIFIIIGGVNYMTSAGDSSKLQKAKNTLTYAIIGLLIVGLAAVITAFVSNMIREAGKSTGGEGAYINQTIIGKEINEK